MYGQSAPSTTDLPLFCMDNFWTCISSANEQKNHKILTEFLSNVTYFLKGLGDWQEPLLGNQPGLEVRSLSWSHNPGGHSHR